MRGRTSVASAVLPNVVNTYAKMVASDALLRLLFLLLLCAEYSVSKKHC